MIHAAKRNVDLTVIMMSNYIYGMTGGQRAPPRLMAPSQRPRR